MILTAPLRKLEQRRLGSQLCVSALVSVGDTIAKIAVYVPIENPELKSGAAKQVETFGRRRQLPAFPEPAACLAALERRAACCIH